jgi:hypothetical protein
MKRILIVPVKSLDASLMELTSGPHYPYRAICMASIVIVKTTTHFRCLKNRWDDPSSPDAKIPNNLMKSYLLLYKDLFTKEELIESLAP